MKYIFFIIIFILINSCGYDCKQDCLRQGLDNNCCPKIDSTKTITPPPLINHINIFLETSGSMVGYMPNSTPATDFQKIIPEILSSLNTGFINKIKLYSIYNSKTRFKQINIDDARDKILNGDFNWSGSTYLPVMIDSITSNYQNETTVNILISDCIYSPDNKDKKEMELTSTDIRTLFTPFSKKFSSSFYCLYSEFRGKKYSTKKSPYYLMVHGKSENLNSISKLINKSISRTNQSFEYLDFGINYPSPYYSILPYTETSANFIAMPCENFDHAYLSVQNIDINPPDSSIIFWIGIDMNNFPNYSLTDSYIKNNLEITVGNSLAKILEIQRSPFNGIEDDDLQISDNCTHIIQFEISKINGCVTNLNLSLKYTRPNWVDSLNENSNENNRSKTFGLNKIFSGFEQAYYPDVDKFLFENLTIALIKN